MASAVDLYNRLQVSGGLLLIDTRDSPPPPEMLVRGAVWLPPLPDTTSAFSLASLLDRLDEAARSAFARRHLQQALLLHGGDASWAERLATALVAEGAANGGVLGATVCSCPVEQFVREYPFLSSARAPRAFKAYPNVIEPGFLFLGNRRQAYDEQMVVEELGITHIVDLHDGDMPPEEPHAAKGVVYHNVRIWDRTDAVLSPHLPKVYQFIEGARHAPRVAVVGGPSEMRTNRVLVHCNQGVSRSATCVAYWLMKRQKINADAAVLLVRRCREMADPNPSFMAQLRRMEERRHCSIL